MFDFGGVRRLGEAPPIGDYIFRIVEIELAENKSNPEGEPVVKVKLEIEDGPEGPIPGLPVFKSIGTGEKSKMYLLNFLEAVTHEDIQANGFNPKNLPQLVGSRVGAQCGHNEYNGRTNLAPEVFFAV